MTSAKKFYAVRVGKQPGIYNSWDTAKAQVAGYPNAKYKSFKTEAEAQAFLNEKTSNNKAPTNSNNGTTTSKTRPEIVVFTDGGSRNHGNVAGGHVKATDPAAWAYLIDYHGKQHSDSAGEFGVTNNKMEITALVQALQWLAANGLNEKSIGIISDSRYVLNAIQKGWITGWKK